MLGGKLYTPAIGEGSPIPAPASPGGGEPPPPSWGSGGGPPVLAASSSSGSNGSRSYVAFENVEPITMTGPAATSEPTTLPPTTWPCPPARSGFLSPGAPPEDEASTTPCNPICPVHHGFAMVSAWVFETSYSFFGATVCWFGKS
nr:hypothetical protein Iba_chr02cCG15250 [Ipomoea batatas]